MKNSYWIILIVLIFIGDQWTKTMALEYFNQPGVSAYTVIENYLVLRLSLNPGAAFGLHFEGARYVFLTLAIIVSLGIVVWLFMHQRTQRFLGLGLALVASGALGNGWDRIQNEGGKVVDFLDMSNPLFSWPVFNVADIAICIGVAIVLFDALFVSGRAERLAMKQQSSSKPANRKT